MILLLIVFSMAGAAFCLDKPTGAGATAPAAVASDGEEKKLISLEFPETSLSTVLDILSIKTGRKFITDTELAQKRIILHLKDVTADEALNALLDTYNLYYVRQNETSSIYVIKKKSDKGDEVVQATTSQIFFLNYATAKSLEDTLKKKLTKNGVMSSDERTNSLIVSDTGDNIYKIASLIKALDIPTLQVLLEAKIVDVKIDSELRIGADINNLNPTGKYWTNPLDVYYQQNIDAGFKIPQASIKPEFSYMQTFAPGLSSGSGKMSFSVLSNGYNIDGIIEAMKKDNNAHLLTNPRLLVMNNNEATIDIVDQVPYQERTVNSAGTTISTVFKDVGIKLKVKPQINRDGSIVLSVAPENSFLNGQTADNIPIINTSKSNTTFIMRDGETAVIGGLIRESETQTEFKVPLLGDIPILGYLFKNRSTIKNRSELSIFITARITQ
jgi:type IV pilus assembly protein PilQ